MNFLNSQIHVLQQDFKTFVGCSLTDGQEKTVKVKERDAQEASLQVFSMKMVENGESTAVYPQSCHS